MPTFAIVPAGGPAQAWVAIPSIGNSFPRENSAANTTEKSLLQHSLLMYCKVSSTVEYQVSFLTPVPQLQQTSEF